MKSAIIVVPSYWSREEHLQGDQVYDHPTSLANYGTLGRLLKSLEVLNDEKIEVLVISCPTSADIAEGVRKKVEEIIEPFRKKRKIYHFSEKALNEFHEHFKTKNKKEYTYFLSIRGYSNIRNLCIAIPYVLGKEVAILIDDDEEFRDEKFIEKACEHICEENPGIAGYYIQPHGSYKFNKKSPWQRTFWDNAAAMNEAFEIIECNGCLIDTPFVFGGNMILHSCLFTKIPFDPYIRRGEDISYLVDAKIAGYSFYLNPGLSIWHFPPMGTMPEHIKMKEDIFRFIYMRRKLLAEGYNISRTMPYPGKFLKANLYLRVLLTSILYAIHALQQGKLFDSIHFFKNILDIPRAYKKSSINYRKFCNLKKKWPEFMEFLGENKGYLAPLIDRG